jgi:hypothetical protein
MSSRDGDASLRQQAQVAKSVAGKREAIFAKRDKLTQKKNQVMSEYETSVTHTEDNKVVPSFYPPYSLNPPFLS